MIITDLAEAVSPVIKLKEIGIRPGEKIHEQMITREDARNTLEFDDYFVILPEICNADSIKLRQGKRVASDFEYNSGKNTWWLSVDEMRELIEEI